MIPRRGLLAGLGALLAAPAIIRTPGLLMPVKAVVDPSWVGVDWGMKPSVTLLAYTRIMSRAEFNSLYVVIDKPGSVSNEGWHSISARERTDGTDRTQGLAKIGSSLVWTKV